MDACPVSKTATARSRRAYLYLRIAATLVAWIVLIAYAHNLAHAYEAELVRLLASPFTKLAATSLFLTMLGYFLFLSLPIVPNLGPRAVAVGGRAGPDRFRRADS